MYVAIHTSIYYCCIFKVMISHMISIDPAEVGFYVDKINLVVM